MPNFVPDEGSKSAPIVQIGEAPGRHENARRKPFVGPSGLKLRRFQEPAGIVRERDCYTTNLYPYQPPNNKLSAIDKAELATWTDDLHERIAALDDPRVIVPMGDYAFHALGFGKHLKITKARGYIFDYTDRRGRTIRVVPTIHPAACFREPDWEVACRNDWRKIASERIEPTVWEEAEHYTRPTLPDLQDFARDVEALGNDSMLSIDIETPGGKIVCIGFSYDKTMSFVVPLDDDNRHWRTAGERWLAWECVRRICASRVPKVFCNGLYDRYWLARDKHAVMVNNHVWDVRGMHHVLHPQEKHRLEYVASMYLTRPYWKDEAKDSASAARYASDFDALLTYCGMDNTVQRELGELLADDLNLAGFMDVYRTHMARLYSPLLALMVHGIRIAARRRDILAARLQARCLGIQDALATRAGEPLHGKQSISNAKLGTYLYTKLKLTKMTKRGTKSLSTDESALRKLQIKHPEHADTLGLVLEHRRKYTLLSQLNSDHADPDGRLRCEYKLYTDTLRLSSSGNPHGTGQNLQNVDREIRSMCLPDEGMFLLEVDKSQAEARVVNVLTGDSGLIDIAMRPPRLFDVHRFNAAIIFEVPEAAVTKEMRYIAKRAVHASNYGMGGFRLSEILLNDTEGHVVRTSDECQAMIDKYIAAFPAIRDWQRRVRMMVLNKKPIVTTWGWPFRYVEGRISEELFKSAYAFRPQSEIACLLNQWGLVPLWRYIEGRGLRSRINLQVHDSLVVSTNREEVYEIASFLRESLERPRVYDGIELVIPAEYKLCFTSWTADIELKELPSEAEFMALVDGRLAA